MQFRIAAVLATLAWASAAPVMAAGPLHSANSEMGYTVHPDHASQGKSRAQVSAELHAARNSAAWSSIRIGAPQAAFESSLTRAQVESELLRAQKHPTWNARRVGAPVSMD